MPHGFRTDITQTRAMRENRFLMERGSFVTMPDSEGKVHFHLEGADRSRMRPIVWARAKGFCQCDAKCGQRIEEGYWEMDHKQGGLSGRCDCLHNLRAILPEHHRARHPQVRFGEGRAKAIEEFDKVNPPEAT